MERISGHKISDTHIGSLTPIPLKINFYIDGYGAKKTAEILYELGDKRLASNMMQQEDLSVAQKHQLYDFHYVPHNPRLYAELISYAIALIELYIVYDIEQVYKARGSPVFPNALLVNRSNPLSIKMGDESRNILEDLYPIDDSEFSSSFYINASCDGTIYSPKKIDRERELAKLIAELNSCESADIQRIAWIRENIKSLDDGKISYKKSRNFIDFGDTEEFYDQVSKRVGYYSRLGENKIHWKSGLDDFGEKGVDCDLIMQVMDDIHQGSVDAFVFMTNDMDFFPLIERLRKEGKFVYVCGLRGQVSNKLVKVVGRRSFFDMRHEALLQQLPSVFMAQKKPELRQIALQWAWLGLRRQWERKT